MRERITLSHFNENAQRYEDVMDLAHRGNEEQDCYARYPPTCKVPAIWLRVISAILALYCAVL